jgi:hypothetical protein
MATDYDPSVLQEYADQLYRRASWIVFWMALRYGLAAFLVIGILAAVFVSLNPANSSPASVSIPSFVGLAVGIFIGIDAGRRKSFNLKLQAQQLLCQRKIELNTRVAG